MINGRNAKDAQFSATVFIFIDRRMNIYKAAELATADSQSPDILNSFLQ